MDKSAPKIEVLDSDDETVVKKRKHDKKQNGDAEKMEDEPAQEVAEAKEEDENGVEVKKKHKKKHKNKEKDLEAE